MISSAVHVEQCPRCGHDVWAGCDAGTGLPVLLDFGALSKLGEALALLDGRLTITMTRLGGKLQIWRRTHFEIKGAPAGTKNRDVVIEHRCADAESYPKMKSQTRALRSVPDSQLPDEPPF